MIIADLYASLTDDQRAAIDAIRTTGADLAQRDDSPGVQKRFAPVNEAFLICFIHETRRSHARGITADVAYDGMIQVVASLVRTIGRNAASVVGMSETAGVVAIAEAVTARAMELARGEADLVPGAKHSADIVVERASA